MEIRDANIYDPETARNAAMLQWLADDLRSYAARLPNPDPQLELLSVEAERAAAQLIVRNAQVSAF